MVKASNFKVFILFSLFHSRRTITPPSPALQYFYYIIIYKISKRLCTYIVEYKYINNKLILSPANFYKCQYLDLEIFIYLKCNFDLASKHVESVGLPIQSLGLPVYSPGIPSPLPQDSRSTPLGLPVHSLWSQVGVKGEWSGSGQGIPGTGWGVPCNLWGSVIYRPDARNVMADTRYFFKRLPDKYVCRECQ